MTPGGQASANLEIKARCADLDAARERARRVATERLGVEHQVVDRYFIPGDAHGNDLGHRLVAAALLRTIEGSGELCSQAASSS